MTREQFQILRRHIDKVLADEKAGMYAMSYEEGMRDILDLLERGYLFDSGNDENTLEFMQDFE